MLGTIFRDVLLGKFNLKCFDAKIIILFQQIQNIYGNLSYCCYCNMSLVICSLKLTMFLICNKVIVSKNINFQIAQAEGNLENQKFFKILLALKMSGASIEVIATPNWHYCHLQKSFAFKIILIKFVLYWSKTFDWVIKNLDSNSNWNFSECNFIFLITMLAACIIHNRLIGNFFHFFSYEIF